MSDKFALVREHGVPTLQKRIAELRGIPLCTCGIDADWENWNIVLSLLPFYNPHEIYPQPSELLPQELVAILVCKHCSEMRQFRTSTLFPDVADEKEL